jgi:hypothetical protein
MCNSAYVKQKLLTKTTIQRNKRGNKTKKQHIRY